MKKLLAIALMFVFLGALAVGCGDKKDTKATGGGTGTGAKPPEGGGGKPPSP